MINYYDKKLNELILGCSNGDILRVTIWATAQSDNLIPSRLKEYTSKDENNKRKKNVKNIR